MADAPAQTAARPQGMPEPRQVTWRPSDGKDLVASVHAAAGTGLHQVAGGSLPVVLLHGLSQQRRFWDPVIARLRTRPVASLDQRGHGQSRLDLDADYRIERCARDVEEFLDEIGWERALVVGHSWGAFVALRCAVGGRAAGIGLIDGGLWQPAGLGDLAQVRERLRPPALGIPEDRLWAMVQASAPYLDDEGRAALAETFETGTDGLVRTRIGVDRHMRVLDGLLQYEPDADLGRLPCPAWAVVCEPAVPNATEAAEATESQGPEDPQDDWAAARAQAISRASTVPGLLIHRWMGAVHDVPLQWPALVAGFIDALHEAIAGPGIGRRQD